LYNRFEGRNEVLWAGASGDGMKNSFAVFTQQLPADIDKGIKIKTEREQQIPSFLLAVRDKAE